MLAKRPVNDAHGGNYEFPGGKIEYGETPEESLIREIHEELKYDIDVEELFSVESEVYGEKHIILISYFCKILSIEDFPERTAIVYVKPSEIDENLPILPPDRRNLDKLVDYFSK